jgi:hypothetical protein
LKTVVGFFVVVAGVTILGLGVEGAGVAGLGVVGLGGVIKSSLIFKNAVGNGFCVVSAGK